MRTPKFNIRQKQDSWKGNIYISKQLNWLNLMEGFFCLFFLFGVGAAFYLQDYGMLLFHSLMAAGFAAVFYYSVR